MADPIRDFLLDDSGNMAIVNGDFALVSGADAVPQGVRIRLETFQGEIWLDESQGVPYLQQILGVKNPDPNVVRELLREAIADTPDVLNVIGSTLDTDNATRQSSISYTITTTYSTGQATSGTVSI